MKDTIKKETKMPRHGRMGGAHMHGTGEKAKNFKGTFQKLLSQLKPYRGGLVLVLCLAIASTIFSIFGPKILGTATTKLFEDLVAMVTGSGTGIDFTYISQILMFLLALYLVSSAFAWVQGFVMSGVSMKMTYKLRQDISVKISRLPFKYFDKKSYGEVLSLLTNDVDVISQSLSQSVTQIITSVTMLIGIMIMMLSISPQMTLVAVCTLPVSLIFVMMIIKKSQKHFAAQQEYLGHMNGHVEEMYGNHTLIKAFNGEGKSIEAFNEYNETLYHSAWKSQFLAGMMFPVMNFIGNFGYVVICIIGGYLKGIAIGDIQAFIQYVRQFTQPITQVANITNILQQTMAAAERIFEFLEEEEETADTQMPVPVEKIRGDVTFEDVHFGYNTDQIIINDFSAHVDQGKKVAIVGPTGAGKTTMVKLLMRFYELNAGSIKIDGVNIRDFTRQDLRSLFGMVLQDAWLYNASIKENIRYGKLTASDDEVITAAKAAQVDHFVRTLPNGYDMVLNEEVSNVSQGQKQLLTIARAILADPKILILDEATSSVDTRTEILIQKAMDNLMKGRTSFIIAHRLSTIRDADLILVMRDGDIAEQGTHEELLSRNGFYASLYNSQFERVQS